MFVQLLNMAMEQAVNSIRTDLGFKEDECMTYSDFEEMNNGGTCLHKIHVARDSQILISFDRNEYKFQVTLVASSEAISVEFAQRLVQITQALDNYNSAIKFHREGIKIMKQRESASK